MDDNIKWEWNAIKHGNTNDCRLCNPKIIKSPLLYARCESECTNMGLPYTNIPSIQLPNGTVITGSSIPLLWGNFLMPMLWDMQFLLEYAENRKRRQSIRTGQSYELLELLSPEKYWGAYEKEMKILEASWRNQHGPFIEFPIIFDSRPHVRSRQVRERKKCLRNEKRGRDEDLVPMWKRGQFWRNGELWKLSKC